MNRTYPISATAAILIAASAQAQIRSYTSDIVNWRYWAEDAREFAFDSFHPGIDGTGDLTGPTVTLDLSITKMTLQRLDPGGALRDASGPFGWVSDAPLYRDGGPGQRWTFSTPIYGMYLYYGSLAPTTWAIQRLYSDGVLIGEVIRYGGPSNGVYAVGQGWISDVPIDRIDFEKLGAGDSVLIGVFIGLQSGEPSLGRVHIPGYKGPHGPDVHYDFALTTTKPNPFKLNVSTLISGSSGRFEVEGARPQTPTYLIYSLHGLGQVYVPQLNVTAGLRQPVQAGSMRRTDSEGRVSWTLPIPSNARGRDVWFQSLQFENASTIVATWIN